MKAINLKSWCRAAVLFVAKLGWACIFGGLFLAAIVVSNYIDFGSLARYDALFIFAVVAQVTLIALKLEHWSEVKAIALFHLVGTLMEVFKTSEGIGSWVYPEESLFRIGNVPLFSGFMYASVGSFMARIWRSFRFDFTHYPPVWQPIVLSVAIYANFFTHHYLPDVRLILFIAAGYLYWRTKIIFTADKIPRKIPLLLAAFLSTMFVWLAENVGTFFRVWLYPEQFEGWQMVSLSKIGSWFLLMIISFVMVSSLYFLRKKD